MYLPAAFKEDRPEVLHALMHARPLVTLITQTSEGVSADHVPVEFIPTATHGVIRGHIARANTLWQRYQAGTPALVVFQGADVYISPSLYATKSQTGEVVPTWDYAVVHARGSLSFTHDADWLRALVVRLTDGQESSQALPWAVDDAPTPYIDKMLQAIVGFEVTIASLQGKWKVSQNRSSADRQGVVSGLRASADSDSLEIAQMLSARSP